MDRLYWTKYSRMEVTFVADKTYLSDILCLNRPYHLQIILYSFKRLSSATLLGPFLTTLSCTKVNKNKFKVLTVYRHE